MQVNRPALSHQRTSSTGRASTASRSPRDGSPVKPPGSPARVPSSPVKVPPINVHGSPTSSRTRLDSPTRKGHPTQNLSRTGSRRGSLLSEATSPTLTRQRSFDSPPQEHATRNVSGGSSHASSSHPSSTPHQPSTLRRVSTPPAPPEPESEPEPEPPEAEEEPQPLIAEPLVCDLFTRIFSHLLSSSPGYSLLHLPMILSYKNCEPRSEF